MNTKNTAFTLLACLLTFLSFGQVHNDKCIELAKAYKDFMFRNTPPKQTLKDIKADVPEDLVTTSNFIVETIATTPKLLTDKYLALPDDKSLKNIYIVRSINYNLREENPLDNNKLIDSLTRKDIPRYELVDAYYDMLFAAAGNKLQPFDFSKINFNLKNYNLKDDTERGIFFLKCMDLCGTSIWGYMNIVEPANTKEAYSYIKRYPRFNSRPYYEFTDLNFPDFNMVINSEKGSESYKGYYINKYYETLLYHLICLGEEGGTEKEINDLLLGSALKEENLYKYSQHKDVLESIFQKVED